MLVTKQRKGFLELSITILDHKATLLINLASNNYIFLCQDGKGGGNLLPILVPFWYMVYNAPANILYLKTHGTDMGANDAPCPANFVMGYWEDLAIWSNNSFSEHKLLWLLYR